MDEFQDTNALQYDIMKLLTDVHQRIFIVGDENQSIFTWRYANTGILEKFLEEFPNAEKIYLEINYRSTGFFKYHFWK